MVTCVYEIVTQGRESIRIVLNGEQAVPSTGIVETNREAAATSENVNILEFPAIIFCSMVST